MKTARGLRLVACFEAAKALLVFAAGCGLLALVDETLQQVAEELVHHLHLNPASHIPRIFLELSRHTGNVRLWMLAAFAFVYASLRMAEAYGLWREQRWAEWVAVISGGIYVPFEVYELSLGVSALKVGTFAINAGIVSYLAWYLRQQHAHRAAAASTSAMR